MPEKTCRIGDVVAWGDVPDGALVRDSSGDYIVRSVRHTECVCSERLDRGWGYWDLSLPGVVRLHKDNSRPFTIIATGLTGKETATDLQRHAEVFEVREAWGRIIDAVSWEQMEAWRSNFAVCLYFTDESRDARRFIERLHAAGWKPGMSAEDAARLLAEVK